MLPCQNSTTLSSLPWHGEHLMGRMHTAGMPSASNRHKNIHNLQTFLSLYPRGEPSRMNAVRMRIVLR